MKPLCFVVRWVCGHSARLPEKGSVIIFHAPPPEDKADAFLKYLRSETEKNVADYLGVSPKWVTVTHIAVAEPIDQCAQVFTDQSCRVRF